jgi:hypothetical protein
MRTAIHDGDEATGSPMRACSPAYEERLASRLIQFGIRTLTPHQREQAERFDGGLRRGRWREAIPAIANGQGPGLRRP